MRKNIIQEHSSKDSIIPFALHTIDHTNLRLDSDARSKPNDMSGQSGGGRLTLISDLLREVPIQITADVSKMGQIDF
jgi:hypothetical protein